MAVRSKLGNRKGLGVEVKREFYTELVLLKPLFELKARDISNFRKVEVLNQQQHDKTKPEITKLIRSCV